MDVSGGLSLVQTVVEKLGSPIWTEIVGILGVKTQLEKLKDTMFFINNVLLDAEEEERQQQGRRSHVERGRLEKLKEALYQADDLFDEVTTLANRKNIMPGNKLRKEVCLFFSRFNQLRFAFYWSHEIKTIREGLDDIVKDHQLAAGKQQTVPKFSLVRSNPRETHSNSGQENDDGIIGRDDDKKIVIGMLLDNSNVEENVSVVSIVGIGGLGKTTLAQLVYNDKKVQQEFPLKMWVCVSDDFNVKALAGQILAAATNQGNQSGSLELDQLQKNLHQALDGKKYLLVLDDVWNKNSGEWQKLKDLLAGGGKGSRILVTTRSKEVVKVVGSSEKLTHELKDISDEASWKLFERMTHPIEPQLIEIGKRIVQKCAKVPLAIRVVGSLLRGQGESRWKYLLNTDLAHVTQDEINSTVPVLKMSYYDLPFHLKSCFSYCAIFPKDYKIIKEDLICLWMAQGFIIPSDGESFEDAGDKYFEHLLQRCFFQDVEVAEGTNEIVSCKMHDLIHDLAKEVAGTDIWSYTYSLRCFNEKTRHAYTDFSTPKDVLGKLSNMQRMRTFLCTKDRYFSPYVGGLLNVKYLRVLRFNDCSGLDKLLSGIGEFVHLRYLDLSHNRDLCVLPSSITKLYNLQTLKLCKCEGLKKLPRELGKLVNLRHLDIDGCSSLIHMPPGMNNMTSLRKLTVFVVGGSGTSNADWSWRSTDDVGQLEDLDDFTNCSRTMKIIVKKDLRYNAEVGRGMLLKSQKLWEIMYKWETEENNNAEVLLQGLQPHVNLRKLELQRYPGVRLPTWISFCLAKLVEIVIRDCNRVEHLPWMSQLRCLKVLEFKGLSGVEYVESTNSGDDKLVFFPSLEKLKLENMAKLKGWWKPSSSESGESDQIPQAPLLSKLYVSDCPYLTTLFLGSSMNLKSCLPNLAEIEIQNCERLEHLPMMSQLHHLKVLKFRGLNEVEYMESNINSGDDDESVFFPSLEKLKLEKMEKLKGWWKPSSSESRESDRIPQAPLLSELHVSECPNLTTLFVGSSMNLKSCLPNLAKIEILHCKRLEHLPLMSQLRHLKVLEFEGLNEVEYMECSSINSGDDNELEFFPSLEKLYLKDMPKLKGWWKSSSESESEESETPQPPKLSCLEMLCLEYMPNLKGWWKPSSEESETPQAPKLSHLKMIKCRELTTFPLCPGLQQLYLEDFNEALGPIQQEEEGSLRKVTIDNMAYLNSLPILSFHHLSYLCIYRDQKMEELKTGEVGEVFRSGRLSTLPTLLIWKSDNLKSISGRVVWDQFIGLEDLSLHSLPELELEDEDDVINNKSTEEGSDAEMPWRYLAPNLRSLTLSNLPKVVKLPKGIGCLSSLHYLDIRFCSNLESLTPSIGGLSSLQSLVIGLCPKLKKMPEEMRHLTSLNELHIGGCSPELMNECYNKNGANWSNIQHIPDIKLDF